MDFYIKQNSTLPFLQIEVFDGGRHSFRKTLSVLTASTVTFSMYDEETGIYRIIDRPAQIVEYTPLSGIGDKTYAIRYQFSKRDTEKFGSFVGEFKIKNRFGDTIIPISNNININILESFTDSDFCCRPNKGLRPVPKPILDCDIVVVGGVTNRCRLIVAGEVTDRCGLVAVAFISDDGNLIIE